MAGLLQRWGTGPDPKMEKENGRRDGQRHPTRVDPKMAEKWPGKWPDSLISCYLLHIRPFARLFHWPFFLGGGGIFGFEPVPHSVAGRPSRNTRAENKHYISSEPAGSGPIPKNEI